VAVPLVRASYGSRVAQAVQCLATGWTTVRSVFDSRQGQRIFPVSSVSRPALGPTQPPVQWVQGVLSPGVKRGRNVTLTTHPHLVPRSRMCRSYTSSLSPSAFMVCSGTALLTYKLWLISTSCNNKHASMDEQQKVQGNNQQ
jgi:hypothetical protein